MDPNTITVNRHTLMHVLNNWLCPLWKKVNGIKIIYNHRTLHFFSIVIEENLQPIYHFNKIFNLKTNTDSKTKFEFLLQKYLNNICFNWRHYRYITDFCDVSEIQKWLSSNNHRITQIWSGNNIKLDKNLLNIINTNEMNLRCKIYM